MFSEWDLSLQAKDTFSSHFAMYSVGFKKLTNDVSFGWVVGGEYFQDGLPSRVCGDPLIFPITHLVITGKSPRRANEANTDGDTIPDKLSICANCVPAFRYTAVP